MSAPSPLSRLVQALRTRELDATEAALGAIRVLGADVVPALRAQLHRRIDKRQRRAVVRLVGELGGAGDVDWLLACADDDALTDTVEWALLQLGPGVVEPLRARLDPARAAFSAVAARALTHLAAPDADTLADWIERSGVDAPHDAWAWLCAQVQARHARQPRLTDALWPHTRAGDALHSLRALEALARLATDDAGRLVVLEAACKLDVTAACRVYAVIAPLRDPSVIARAGHALRTMRRPSPRPFDAIMGLRIELGDPTAMTRLREGLDPADPWFDVRVQAAGTAPPDALLDTRLRALLDRDDVGVGRRVRLCIALVARGDRDAADRLLAELPRLSVRLQLHPIHVLLTHLPQLADPLTALLEVDHHVESARLILKTLETRDAIGESAHHAVHRLWRTMQDTVAQSAERRARRTWEDASLVRLAHDLAPLDDALARSLAAQLDDHADTLREQQPRFVHGGMLELDVLARNDWPLRAARLLTRRADALDAASREPLGARMAGLTRLLGWFRRQLPAHGPGDARLDRVRQAAIAAGVALRHAPWLDALPEALRRDPGQRLDEVVRTLDRRGLLSTHGPTS